MNKLFAQVVKNPEILNILEEMYEIVKEIERNPMLRMKLLEFKENLQ